MEVTDKITLRRRVKSAVKAMELELRASLSREMVSLLYETIVSSGVRVVALFSPLPDEPMIAPLISLLSSEIKIVLPRVEGDVMQFFPYVENGLESGSYGILEPQGNIPIAPSEIDLMVVPGVAFTKNGTRMGRRKGYYDKYMSQEGFRAYKVGVCYAVQLVDALPTEPHDVAVDMVISK